jgi:hypothetical protein
MDTMCQQQPAVTALDAEEGTVPGLGACSGCVRAWSVIPVFHFRGRHFFPFTSQAAGLLVAPAADHALKGPVAVTTSPVADSVIPEDPRTDFSPVSAALARVGEVHTITS